MRNFQPTRARVVASSFPSRSRPSALGPASLATTRKAKNKNDDRPDPTDDMVGGKTKTTDDDDTGPVWIPEGAPVPPGMVPSLGPHGQPHDQKEPD